MNERIKELRKALNHMTQQKFADALGVKRNTVAQWEIGLNGVSDQIVRSICREFNVNEEWLRYGTGDMFLPAPTDVLDKLVAEYRLSPGAAIMVERFVRMNPKTQQEILDYFVDVAQALSEPSADAPAEPTDETAPSADETTASGENDC